MAKSVTFHVQQRRRIADALPTVLPDAMFLIDNVRTTTAEVVADYRRYLAHEAAIVELQARIRIAVANLRVERKAIHANDLAVRAYAFAVVGEHSAAFASLGFAPHKIGKPSVATKAVAIAKGQATRDARHTLGPRRKAKIRGAVPPELSPSPTPPSTSNPTPPVPT